MEEQVIINNKIYGIYKKPNSYKGKFPVVILLHEFGSNKNEVNNTFLLLAEQFMANNIASIRFNFSGFGESKVDGSEAF